jgi:hypothetical protein
MKKSETFLIDTMVLINFTERCESRDLFGYFQKLEIRFQIVEEVEVENQLISEAEKDQIFAEMIEKGLWIKTKKMK